MSDGSAVLASTQFFDFNRLADRRLLFVDAEMESGIIEIEDPSQIAAALAVPGSADILAIQHKGGRERDGFRWTLLTEPATEIGRALAGSRFRTLALVVASVASGALPALAAAARNLPLDTLFVAWFFTGNDISGTLDIPRDLAHVVQTRGLRRLSLLTNNWIFDGELAQLLAENQSLTDFAVWAKDADHTWPAVRSPAMDALVMRNRALAATAAAATAPPAQPRRLVTCGRCSRQTTQLMCDYVEASWPDYRNAITSGRLFEYDCQHCGQRGRSDFSVFYADRTRGFLVKLTSPEEMSRHRAELVQWARTVPGIERMACRMVTSRLRLRQAIRCFEAGLHDGVLCFTGAYLQERFPNQEVLFRRVFTTERDAALLFTGHRGDEAEIDSGLVTRASYDDTVKKVGDPLTQQLQRSHETWPNVDVELVLQALDEPGDSRSTAPTRWVWISIPKQGRVLAYTYVDPMAGPSAKGAAIEGPEAVSILEAVEHPTKTFRDPTRFGAIPISRAEASKLGLPEEPTWMSIFTHGTFREPAAQPTSALTGLVTRRGKPVASAEVQIGRIFQVTGEFFPVAKCATGVDGRFAFVGAPEGPLCAIARHGDLLSSYVGLGENGSTVLELLGVGALHGTVVRDGKPTSAYVELLSPDQSRPRRLASSDGDGRFHCSEIVPGRYTIEVTALDSNHRPNGAVTHDACVIGDGETVRRDYAVAAGGTIELEIRTADDRNEHPIVCLIAGSNIPTRFVELRAMYRSKELRSANSFRILRGVHTTSFLDVPPGRSTVCVVRHRLDAPAPDDAPVRSVHVDMAAEPQRVVIDLLRD